jgi:4-nitrophenyl phosphatase
MKSRNYLKLKALILDMDGVLWRGEEPLGKLPELFAEIDRRGYKVAMVTNNAMFTVEQYLDKLLWFGVELDGWQIINSSQAAAHFLIQQYPRGGPVFVIGEEGLCQVLSADGFYQSEESVLAVVVGLDRSLTYKKLETAALLIQTGVQFIGTNPDRSFPTPYGLIPGAGAILAALETATSVKPIVVGKPSPEMYLLALERLETSPSETLVVGDRLETDILGAQSLGCHTALVLSGVSSEEHASLWEPAPDFIAPDLTRLLEEL